MTKTPVQGALTPAGVPSSTCAAIPRSPRFATFGDYSWTKHGPQGWYSLNSFICTEIGGRLVYWADHGMSTPMRANPETGDHWTAEEWKGALRHHGCALLAFAEAYHSETDGIDITAAHEGAKAALAFIGEYLDTLWD